MGYGKHTQFIDELFTLIWGLRSKQWEIYNRKLFEYIQDQGRPVKLKQGLQKPSISEYDLIANGYLRIFLHIRDVLYIQDDLEEEKMDTQKEPYPLPPLTDNIKADLGKITSICQKYGVKVPEALTKK